MHQKRQKRTKSIPLDWMLPLKTSNVFTSDAAGRMRQEATSSKVRVPSKKQHLPGCSLIRGCSHCSEHHTTSTRMKQEATSSKA
eukprot:2210212-Prorocentrum_lima.AAC.1